MTDIALRLKDELLALSEDDRMSLLEILQNSLPHEVEEGYDEAWETELNRRMEEIESGKAAARSTKEMFDELRKRYS